jgi:hypothetical protein
MSKSNIAVIVLVITLIASNGLWAYASMSGNTPARSSDLKSEQNKPTVDAYYDAILPLEAAIAASASPHASRESIVSAASGSRRPDKPGTCMWDKDVVRVRGVGLQFDRSGKLIGATTSDCAP